MLAVASLGAAASLGMSALAQQPMAKISIDNTADYNQSLKCYQYYDVAQQVATAMASRAAADSDEQKIQQTHVAADKALKAAWNKHIDATKGKKSNKAVDDDLAKEGASVIADANSTLKGDKDAGARNEALHSKCTTFERVEQTPG
jgi:hypothetical protein